MNPINPGRTAPPSSPGFNAGSFGHPGLTTLYIAFEKEKAPSDVLRELSEANLFVAMNPGGCTTTPDKVIEILVPSNTPIELVRNALSNAFPDLEDVTAHCAAFTVSVPVTEYKQARTALRKVALRVNPFDRVIEGNCYFPVLVSPSTDAAAIAECLNNAKISLNTIAPAAERAGWPGNWTTAPWTASPWTASPNPATPWTRTAGYPAAYPYNFNPTFAYNQGYNPAFGLNPAAAAYDPSFEESSFAPSAMGTSYNLRSVCESLLPILGRELTAGGMIAQALNGLAIPPGSFWRALQVAAQPWTSGAFTGWNHPPVQPYGANGIGRTIQRTHAELCNPTSPLCQALRTTGIHPPALASLLLPFVTGAGAPMTPLTAFPEDVQNPNPF